MADSPRSRLPPIQTHHARNVSTNTVESDSSDSSPNPLDDRDEIDFMLHDNDSSSTIGALTAIRDSEMELDTDYLYRLSPIQMLPPEILVMIFSKLTTAGELRNCMLVSYHWALYAVQILWHRPLCSKWSGLLNVGRALSAPHPSYPYSTMVKRLNLSGVADKVNDGTAQAFMECKAIERLTLTSCIKLTDQGVMGLVDGTKRLQALDVTDLEALTDASMHTVAKNCPKLQGLNITNCSYITDESLVKIAEKCIQLKRLKLNGVVRATDDSIVKVAEQCRSILEIDLAGCHSISSASVTALLTNLPHLRELRLAQCVNINSRAFTDLKPNLRFDALRILDLTACDGVGDDAIARIIPAAPRLRNLVLAKCRNITDQAVKSICALTKNLHYIHLGHCQQLSDLAVIDLVQQCNRIRYIDLACCSRLTDASVRHLAKLPKLRRVGLVKCQNLTDASIIALARGPHGSGAGKPGMPTQFVSLERVHLSYCTSLTLKGITQLLLNCPRLTHLSLTGVQAFLRDDLTRFCREAPTEFTHVQRDVFCVFSGDGVVRLRDYLARLALEQQERDAEQQNAIDEQVVGPDSPDADSLSDGTIDGNESQQMDTVIFGPGRGPRGLGARSRTRPQSFPELPRPNFHNFHMELPLLPADQMQRMGPWTPSGPNMTPEMRPQPTPPFYNFANAPFGPGINHDMRPHQVPSPIPRTGLGILESQQRSRSQSRRHTLDGMDGYFGPASAGPSYSVSRGTQPEGEVFGYDHIMLPTFSTTMHGGLPSPDRPQTRRGVSALRPDPNVNCFDVNHEAILSTIPNSRGPSRGPSRSNSPHLSRVQSRPRMGHFPSNTRAVSTPSYADVASGRISPTIRSGELSRQRHETGDAMLRALASQEAEHQSRYEHFAGPSSSTWQHPPLLPSDLMHHVLTAPDTPMDSPGEMTPSMLPARSRHQTQRDTQGDVNMTQ